MLTIKRKYAVVLGIVFITALVSFNLFMDKFFSERFKDYVSQDMRQNYGVSSKNLDDYVLINNIEINKILSEELRDKAMKFIVDRVYCQGVLFDLEGNVTATGVTGEKEIDLSLLEDLPKSFELAKNNKTVLDIERRNSNVYGKLSYSIYGKSGEVIGILVLVKDYSEELGRNTTTKNFINGIVAILFIMIFISVYYLSSKMVRPIIMLKDKVSEISKGKYPEKLPVTSKDEIGILVNSFNTMSEKLRVKDEQEKNIFRNITHELKTPLASISGYAQILGGKNFNDEVFRKKSLDRIISESDRMHELVVTLLNISKQSSDLEEYSFEKVNVKNILKEVISLQLPKVSEKALNINCECGDVFVKGNEQYLRILFSNLIDNGIKYSNSHSDVLIRLVEENHKVIFSISTDGKEIPDNMKKKIFEPFIKIEKTGFSSKTSHGLGLYICNNIALAHNGIIELNVNKNKSEFIVKLPSFYTLETS